MPFLLTVVFVVDFRASNRLNKWKSSLSAELEVTPMSATPHKLMLHLAYWWLFILLHRPFFYHKSRPILSTDREINHVEVTFVFLRLLARNLRNLIRFSYVVGLQNVLWIYYQLGAPSTHSVIAQSPSFKLSSPLVLCTS